MKEELHPVQIEAYKRMSPLEKLELAAELRQAAWVLKAEYLTSSRPDLSEKQIQAQVREIFLYART